MKNKIDAAETLEEKKVTSEGTGIELTDEELDGGRWRHKIS